MKRFFPIASAIFILGIWIPLLAAATGFGKQICGKGIFDSHSQRVEHQPYSQNTEISLGEFQKQGNGDLVSPEQRFAQEKEVQHKKQALLEQKEKLHPGVGESKETKSTSVQVDKNENAPSEQPILPPVSENNHNTQDSISENFSFNFLYYLFYKFSISDFFKKS